ncbi:MAG: AI-2E family transporter [Tepidisphaeraceae bacterium]
MSANEPDPPGPIARADELRADRRVQTVCLLVLTLIASAFAMSLLRPVLVPFVLALFLTYCLAPLIDVQTRRLRVPAPLAVLSSVIVGLALLFLAGVIIAAAADKLGANLKTYQDELSQLTQRFANRLPLTWLGISPAREAGVFMEIPRDATGKFFTALLGEATAIVSNGTLVVIFMIFILVGRAVRREEPSALLAEIESRVIRYVQQMMLFSAVTGALVAATLSILGVDYAGVFGFLAFLLNFIPSVGGIIATLLPLPVILLSPELSVTTKVLALAVPGGIQFVIGNLVQPKVMGEALHLHPVAVLMALIFFGMIWGLVGAFLATPITAVIKIILEKIDATRPLGLLLGGDVNALSWQRSRPTR